MDDSYPVLGDGRPYCCGRGLSSSASFALVALETRPVALWLTLTVGSKLLVKFLA